MKNLYTIFIEIIDGGTYIEQIFEEDEYLALLKWFEYMKKSNSVKEFNKNNVLDIIFDLTKNVEDYKPLKIDNKINVWCTFFSLEDISVLINIVLTVTKP